jgi:uncharacterized DUF497 family protein
MDYEWDLIKEIENYKKHGYKFSKAIECFADPNGFLLEDVKHSGSERRYYWIGKSKNGEILTTRLVFRHNKIRIIGVAKWRNFRRIYDEKTKNIGSKS